MKMNEFMKFTNVQKIKNSQIPINPQYNPFLTSITVSSHEEVSRGGFRPVESDFEVQNGLQQAPGMKMNEFMRFTNFQKIKQIQDQ